jgi:hypothetical protein
MKPHDTCWLYAFGPGIVVDVVDGTYQLLLWNGRVVFTDESSLSPLPTKESERYPGVMVPDYRVAGVGEIVSLVVDLMAEPPQRIKSPLYPLLSSLEALNREKSEADKAARSGEAPQGSSDANQ